MEVSQFALTSLKRMTILAMQAASQRHGMALDGEQELLVHLAKLLQDCFAVDSAVARTLQRQASGEREAVAPAICAVAAVEAAERGALVTRRALISCYPGDQSVVWIAKLDKVATDLPITLVPWRRAIAAAAVDNKGYKLATY